MTTNESLRKYLFSLSRKERRAKVVAIMAALDVKYDKLQSWWLGRTFLHIVFLDKIGEIVGEDLSSRVEK